jgi:hypothetical protein
VRSIRLYIPSSFFLSSIHLYIGRVREVLGRPPFDFYFSSFPALEYYAHTDTSQHPFAHPRCASRTNTTTRLSPPAPASPLAGDGAARAAAARRTARTPGSSLARGLAAVMGVEEVIMEEDITAEVGDSLGVGMGEGAGKWT